MEGHEESMDRGFVSRFIFLKVILFWGVVEKLENL